MVIDRSLADWDVAIECISAPLAEPIKGLRENIRYFWCREQRISYGSRELCK